MLKKIVSFILIFTLIYTIITEDIAYADNFNLKSKSAILMDANTGKVLYEKIVMKNYLLQVLLK